MRQIAGDDENMMMNADSPFTELFLLIKRYNMLSIGLPILAYRSNELEIINQHIEDVMNILLQGLHGLGYFIGIVSLEKKLLKR